MIKPTEFRIKDTGDKNLNVLINLFQQTLLIYEICLILFSVIFVSDFEQLNYFLFLITILNKIKYFLERNLILGKGCGMCITTGGSNCFDFT